MNKSLNRIRTELLEIYGESYPRFLKAEIMVYAFYLLLTLLFFLSSQPYIIRTVSSWGMAGIFVIVLLVIVLFIMIYIERYKVRLTQEMEQKFKQTAYYRWIRRGLKVVLSMLTVILPQWLNHQLQSIPISQAVSEYGYPVYLPTQLPFKPTKQYAEITTNPSTYEMEVSYENNVTQLVLYISQDDEEDLHLSNAVLKNGTKADYEDYKLADYEDYELTWYQNGFRYELIYYPPKNQLKPTKEFLLSIANSFKPVHP